MAQANAQNAPQGQLLNSIELTRGTERIRDAIAAPIGQPAVNISGNSTQLNVTRSGSISAPDAGNSAVVSSGESVTIRNSGSIAGAFNGITSTGNALQLNNSGTISSDSRALDLSDGDGVVVRNSGSILGTGNQRNGTLYVDGTVDDLDIRNTRRGVIDAGLGNLGDALSVQVGAAGDPSNSNISINNSGLLQGRGDGPGVFADGSRVAANGSSGLRFFNGSGLESASISGSVRNSGTITSEVNVGFLGGLIVEDGVAFNGRIDNTRQGVISGPRNGLYIGNAAHNLEINNSGRIESGSRAVNIDGTGVDFRNTGTVIGTGNQRNGTVYSDSTADNYSIFNGRRGVIDAGSGNQGAGISLQTGDVVGDVVTASVTNRGTVQGRGDGADGANLAGDGVRLFTSVEGSVTFQGNIDNSGSILGTQDGVVVQDNVTLSGNIDNSRRGQIVGDANGVNIEGVLNGAINNSGTIRGGENAINAQTAEAGVIINNSGTLDGNVTLSEFNDVVNSSRRSAINGTLSGLGGDDVLVGGRTDDILVGGIGNDQLTGGLGQDIFAFGESHFGTDVIRDFSNGQDRIDISGLGLGAGEVDSVIAQAQEIDGATQLTFAQGSIRLEGFAASNLDASDFVL